MPDIKITVESLAFTCDGHRYRGERIADMTAFHSGRPLYHVKCETCGVDVTEATTSTEPAIWVRWHADARVAKAAQ
jgi:hypothetical protein